jgi:hypothetical protein
MGSAAEHFPGAEAGAVVLKVALETDERKVRGAARSPSDLSTARTEFGL